VSDTGTRTDVPSLPVSEVFGPTVQGEGPAAGRAASFVRFMGCNLSCTWCDSAWTWDASRFELRAETTQLSAREIGDRLRGGPAVVVLTGGEPLLQQDRPAWRELLPLLTGAGHHVHIETNGTVAPSPFTLRHASMIVVSPKLPNAGEHRGHQVPTIHAGFAALNGEHDHLHAKIVCIDAADVTRAAAMAADAGFPPARVWVMPEGTTTAVLAVRWPVIAQAAAAAGVNATHRLHVLAWGDQRGH
jgi:7-carboxy-7-deazaguanine synthase